MSVCIHGDLCRAYMKKFGIVPYSVYCPNQCKFYESKQDVKQSNKGCHHWPNKCEDCPNCGGEGVIPLSRYNK